PPSPPLFRSAAIAPAPAEQEHRMWYQYYFHTERGRAGLMNDRRDICRLLWRRGAPGGAFDGAGVGGRARLVSDRTASCRLLWRLWSPEWPFDEATFERSAASFDNPDFVDVVI